MNNSKISSSAQSYLDSLQKETKKLLTQKYKENASNSKVLKKNNQKQNLGDQKKKNFSESPNLSDITSSIDSDALNEIPKLQTKRKSKNNLNRMSSDKSSFISSSSNDSLSNQNVAEKESGTLSDSNRYSVASIPADKYLKMIRHSIDTSLFMGTKNEIYSNEISPLSSETIMTNQTGNETSNQNIKNKKENNQKRNNFKMGNLTGKTERQETIMELDDIIKKDVNNNETKTKQTSILPISAFRKQPISLLNTKHHTQESYNMKRESKNKSISLSSSISSDIKSVIESISDSSLSSILTVKPNNKISKRQKNSLSTSMKSISSSLADSLSTSNVTSDSKTTISSSSSLSTTSSLSNSTIKNSSNRRTSDFSESSTTSSLSTIKKGSTKESKKESKEEMNSTFDSVDDLISSLSELSEKSSLNKVEKTSHSSGTSSSQSFYSISEENIFNNKKDNVDIKNLFSNDTLKKIQMDIIRDEGKLSLLGEKKNIKLNKNDILKNIIFPYYNNIKRYMIKEEEISDIIENNLYTMFCKNSTEIAIKNVFL
ncbi:Hypothetical protein SRAE_X000023700 [Strongyloides ratti]|uniref:Uncharacterized protein n=1 Tax=Strongyloides ratti TaxID=34506 RepID=A0A090LRT3_STRRB|nr:Hypothetical protein SRAE_X000023700 [Strongyloides ratti]CEF70907.1 Hypothetical protein SRAE_X000023700 [Strongyloides ratti]